MSNSKASLVAQLRQTIIECRQDEDLPFWGEVFVLLHELKKLPANQNPLYEIDPIGEVVYDRPRRCFIVRVPDMDMTMKHSELADAIVKKGLFHPKPEPGIQAEPEW